MKRIGIMLLVLLMLFSIGATAEVEPSGEAAVQDGDLFIAYGIPFGTSRDEIVETLSKYEGLEIHSDESEFGSITVRYSENYPKLFGREVSRISFWYDKNGLYETNIDFFSNTQSVLGSTGKLGMQKELYSSAIESWPNIISELIAQYASPTHSAAYGGTPNTVEVATLIGEEYLASAKTLKIAFPYWYFDKHDKCGIVLHFNNVMVELTLSKGTTRTTVGTYYQYYDKFTVTYQNKPYGELTEISPHPYGELLEPTPTAEPTYEHTADEFTLF